MLDDEIMGNCGARRLAPNDCEGVVARRIRGRGSPDME